MSKWVATFGLVLIAAPAIAYADGVMPRWTLHGRGIVASPVKVVDDGSRTDATWSVVDFADTFVNTRFDSAMFDDTVAGFAIGARLTDLDSPLKHVYLYQAEGALQARNLVVRAGRSRRPGTGIMFPTLRDEDLLTFVYPLNPYSVGGLEEDALFSDKIHLTGRFDFRWHLDLAVESLRDTKSTGDPGDAAGPEIDAAFARVYYDQLPSLAKISFVKHAELGLFGQRLEPGIPGLDRSTVLQLTGSVSANLFPDPIHLVDVRLASVYQHGAVDQPFEDVADLWGGRYVSGAVSFRYLFAPYQLERFQAALTFAAQRYTDRSAQQIAIIPTVVYRLGRNADLAAQYIGMFRSASLAAAEGVAKTEHRFEVAFAYRFEVMMNDTINLPRDLLNADYNYIPIN